MKFAPILILFFFLVACQTLPAIKEPSSAQEKNNLACPHPFLRQKTTFIHAIEVQLAGKIQSSIIGITMADPVVRSVSCAIMTAEGMVLFEANESAGQLNIRRALPPFDDDAFAKKMIADIKFIFFAPEGNLENKGFLPGGETACRWREDNGDRIDVSADQKKSVEVKRYLPDGRLKRQIKFNKMAGGVYQSIELHAKELSNYSLLMTLIEVQPFKN